MFNKRKSLLLGILAAATATGLALGVNGVVDAYVGEPVEVSALEGDVLAELDKPSFSSSSYGVPQVYNDSKDNKWQISSGTNAGYIGCSSKQKAKQSIGYPDDATGFFDNFTYEIGEEGFSSESLYSTGLICETPFSNVDSISFWCEESPDSGAYAYPVYCLDGESTFNLVPGNQKTFVEEQKELKFEFESIPEKAIYGFVFYNSNYFRFKNIKCSIVEGANSARPSDAKPVSIALDYGTGRESFYQNEDFDSEGYDVQLVYGSDTNPEYSEIVNLDPYDESLSWSLDTSTLGYSELSLTYSKDGIVLTSESLLIEIIEMPAVVDMTDTLVADMLTATGTSYKAFENVSDATGSLYAGQTSKNNGISIRSDADNEGNHSGIINTVSAGTIKSIKVAFNTTADRTINVYGSNAPFNSVEDLYEYADVVGTISTSGGSVQTFDMENVSGGPFKYFGIRSQKSAIILSSIEITYAVNTKEVDEFVSDFFEGVKCDGGITQPDIEMWDLVGSEYLDLSDVHKAEIQKVTPNYEDTSTIAGVLARYDYIVGKYGTEKYSDFMGRNPAPIASALSIHNSDDMTDIAVISALAIAGIAAAGAFVFLRRKKEA